MEEEFDQSWDIIDSVHVILKLLVPEAKRLTRKRLEHQLPPD